MLKIKVIHLYIALFLVNCLVSFVVFVVPFYFFDSITWNTPTFRFLSFLISLVIISIIDFKVLYGRFINVRPSASFAYMFDDGPWFHFIDDPRTSIVINWITKESTYGFIEFGDSIDTMKEFILEEKDKIHRKSFINLIPDKVYYYRIQHLERVYSFKTAPEMSDHVMVAVIGDTQNGGGLGDPNWSFPKIADAIKRESKLDVLLHVGDLTDQGNDLRSWHAYFASAKDILSKVPMFVAVGNHDTGTNHMHDKEMKKYPDEGANFDYFLGYKYSVPETESQTTSFRGRYYSFDYENCHFIMLDSQNSKLANPENPQWKFIKNDLTSVPRQMWKIACIHRDIIDIQRTQTGEITYRYDRFSPYVCPLLHKYGVDVVFQGHDHVFQVLSWKYTENKTIYSNIGEIMKLEIPYITTGGAGNELRKNQRIEIESKDVDSGIITENSSHYLIADFCKEICEITAKYHDGSILYRFSIRK